MKVILRKIWRLLPQSLRTGLVDKFDEGYVRYHLLIDSWYDRRLNISTIWVHKYDGGTSRKTLGEDPAQIKSTSYLHIRSLRNYLSLGPKDVFLDIGCGTGRAVIFMAMSEVGKSRGIDFSEDAIKISNKNLAGAFIDRTKASFTQEDAAKASIDDATVIYLGNPFGPATMTPLLKNIQKSLQRHPRTLRVCYYNPTYRSLFEDTPWLSQVHVISTQKVPIVIYQASA